MGLIEELFIVVFRIATILPLLLAITLFMGKRSIGALPVFDFLVIMTLASVTGADIAQPDVQHIHTVVAIIGIALLQRFASHMIIKNRKVGRWMTFEPTIVIHNGKLLPGNLEKLRYSVDNILQMLREKNVFDISSVKLAIVEGNGALTVQLEGQKENVTIEDLNLTKKSPGIAYPVILEGKVYVSVLEDLGLTLSWLHEQLVERGYQNTSQVFYASINDNLELHISENEYRSEGPAFYH
ncbi:DUF421 domain-containing protein [Bacillus sp. H-16]|uniref:DUF421 domain-containing protein n=1 Tax=Alteribacter salitolerans TaxID=2912333 RepID=UPI0019644F9B|nr:DUF421 domain-containing protein [Alteribacter salitolerans]MBM7094715.1 DUF421 domain-containing protein [Alteribacter salitolerans]